MKIELYLEGNKVEINKDIDFVLNKQFTELSDLTSIIVDYSKTIKVPMTPHNNELFNYVYKLERQTLVNDEIITYDPSQKIGMTMLFNGSTVMEGYALLNSVDLKGKVYEINLYGQLGKIFSDLKEKPLKGNNDGRSGYHTPNNGWSASMRMHTLNIAKSFMNTTHSLSWSSSDWTDFYGFTPQLIGDSDMLTTDSFEQYSTHDIIKFTDYINNARGITYADIYVKDGFDLNQYNEVRTYTCRPYVYVDKLIQLVQNEINQGDYDGYTMALDADWFNADNPYYANLCYFPGNESIVDSGETQSGLVSWDNSERNMNFPLTFLPNTVDVELDGYTYTTNDSVVTISATGGGDTTATLTLNCDGIVVRDRVTGVGNTDGFNENGRWAFYNLSTPQEVPIRYLGIYDGSDKLLYKLYLCDDTIHSVTEDSGFLYWSWSHYPMGGVWSTLRRMSSKNVVPNSTTWVNNSVSNSYCEVTQVYNFGNVVLPTNSFKFKMGCDYINIPSGRITQENISYSNYHTLCPFKNDKYKNTVWNTSGSTFTSYFNPISTLTVSSNTYRSMSYWTIYDILGNDFNPFTWLIDYVKQFRLFFDIDYNTKVITLKKGYFNNITYKKVTVDYSKGMVVEPVVDKFHSVKFGYRKNDCKKGVKYYKNYGVEYGDIDIYTGLNINNETLTLSPNENNGVFVPIKMDSLNFDTLKDPNQPIKYNNQLMSNRVITTLDKDGKIQYFPFYAFRWESNSTTLLFITDDSPNQRNSGEYCYLEHSNLGEGWRAEVETTEGSDNVYYQLFVMYLPQFDNYIPKQIDGNWYLYWNTFNVPSEVYNGYLPRSIQDNVSIYSQRWVNYLSEIFNIHNKKVTCYVRMSYPEFINFKFNQLFVIDNCTFLVNKIIDFNPNSTEPTKVELIEVSDVTNLQ